MLLLASLVLGLGQGLAPAQTIGSLFQEIFEERLADHPEFATQVGRREYDHRWTDLSASGRARRSSGGAKIGPARGVTNVRSR